MEARADIYGRIPVIGDEIAWSCGYNTTMSKGRVVKISRKGNPIVTRNAYSRGREITDYPRGHFVIVKNL